MPRLVASSLSALNKPHMASSRMIEKGSALAMVAVCKAVRPSANNSAMATAPIDSDQKMRCQTGVRSAPPDASKSTTSAPESAEVTKNTTTMAMATNEMTLPQGICSRKANSASVVSLCTVSAKPWTLSIRIMWMAVSPNTVIQNSVKPVGTSSTPLTNSRMVRPREMRAMNSPTNGDHAIHQPQENSVQPPIQSVGADAQRLE